MVDLPEGSEPGGHRARAVRRGRHRPRSCPRCSLAPGLCRHRQRRSTSTAWCATTICARRPELGELQVNLRREADRKRASHAIALDLRERLEGARLCQRAPASRWSRCRRGRRCWRHCSPRSTAPTRQTRRAVADEAEEDFHRRCPSSSTSTTSSASRARACGCRIDQDGSNFSGSSRSDVYDTIRALFGGIPSATRTAARNATRSRSACGLPKRDLSLGPGAGLDAGARQHGARQQDRGRTRPGRACRACEAGFADDLPPRRPFRRHGDGRARRRVRGADLRHAGGGQGDRGT